MCIPPVGIPLACLLHAELSVQGLGYACCHIFIYILQQEEQLKGAKKKGKKSPLNTSSQKEL